MFVHVYTPLAMAVAEPLDVILREVCIDIFNASWSGRRIKGDDIAIAFTDIATMVTRPKQLVLVQVYAPKRELSVEDRDEIARQITRRTIRLLEKHYKDHINPPSLSLTVSVIWIENSQDSASM